MAVPELGAKPPLGTVVLILDADGGIRLQTDLDLVAVPAILQGALQSVTPEAVGRYARGVMRSARRVVALNQERGNQ